MSLKEVTKDLGHVETDIVQFKKTKGLTADVKDQSQALLESTTTTQKQLTDKEQETEQLKENLKLKIWHITGQPTDAF